MKISTLASALVIFTVLPALALEDLPPGVPRVVGTNGEILFIESQFTTSAFQNEALRLILAEANKVAAELHLQESLPINVTNLTRASICPFGYSVMQKCVGAGNITTRKYCYSVMNDKFNSLVAADYDAHYVRYQSKKYDLPNSQLNTNAAYQLAVKWLTDIHMDVRGLERDCNVRIALTSDLAGTKRLRGKFTPLYYIIWTPKNIGGKPGGGAYVELYLPRNILLQMEVDDSKYIFRAPIVVTNLAALFPGKATIITNCPGPITSPPVSGTDGPNK